LRVQERPNDLTSHKIADPWTDTPRPGGWPQSGIVCPNARNPRIPTSAGCVTHFDRTRRYAGNPYSPGLKCHHWVSERRLFWATEPIFPRGCAKRRIRLNTKTEPQRSLHFEEYSTGSPACRAIYATGHTLFLFGQALPNGMIKMGGFLNCQACHAPSAVLPLDWIMRSIPYRETKSRPLSTE
jgi:hypothetical protein